jgi:hypothetical protein
MKRVLLVSIVCLAAGAGGGFYASQSFGATLFSGMTDVDGVVVDKEKDGSRLVLAIESKSGNRVLAMFTKRRADVDQLVNEGDRITLRLPRDRTLVDNPPIVRVIKPEEEAAPEEEHAAAHEESAPPIVRYSYGLPLDAGVYDAGLTTPHVETHEPTEVAEPAIEDDAPEEITVAELLARATRASDGAFVVHAGETADHHAGPAHEPPADQRPDPAPSAMTEPPAPSAMTEPPAPSAMTEPPAPSAMTAHH